jgi:tetratricopeptide (TPR) repeat protein
MRKMTALIPPILIVIAMLAAAPGAIPPVAAQGGSTPEPAHLVLSVDNGTEARINRMNWDVNAWAPLLPGASVRASDYLDLAGRTTVSILCADLSVIDQLGSEAPRCNPYPGTPAFHYADDPTWTMRGSTEAVVTLPNGIIPPEVRDPGAYAVTELGGADLDALNAQVSTIMGLGVSPEAQAFALSSLYRDQGVLFEALGVMTAISDLGCSERRPAVEPPPADARPLLQSAVVYLRVGELYEMLGQNEDAMRNYRCAGDLAQATSDPADLALAYARQANLSDDPAQAIQFYQQAINNYAQLGAKNDVDALMNLCGARSCSIP